MICVSLAEPSVEKCLDALQQLDFAEIRLDRMDVSQKDIQKIFSHPGRLIATFRPGNNISEEQRKTALKTAISAGAAYVDIEAEAGDRYKNELRQKAVEKNCRIIFSYHNFDQTPSSEELENLIEDCFASGAEIVKIACRALSPQDNLRLLSLLKGNRSLIVIGLGTEGAITRIAAPLLGSLFTYASLSPGKETADGQLDSDTLKNILRKLKNA